MKILLTNDDGIHAEGLLALVKYLEKKHEVWVVAPDRNRSGVSHGITMAEPLKLCQLAENRFSCSGVPADCTFTAINGILNEYPDVVISGINKGPNLGTDIIFSGTAAAARQASFYGIPGIAVSLASFEEPLDYSALADFVSKNIEKLVTLCEKDIFLNINADSLSSYKGYKFTSLSKRSYKDKVSVYNAPDGKLYSFFVGGGVESFGDEDSDEKAVSEGYVSISRVLSQPVSIKTDLQMQESLCLTI
jgi:5'-nucleotidase